MANNLSHLSTLSKRLGYEFNDLSLLQLALSHRSVGAKNNERLEFIGDSIVNFFMAEALFEKFPECREGELSQMRSQLVKGATLAELAREFELGDHLNLGSGEMKSGGFRRESILADTVEAIIAAIYIDAGMEVCKIHVSRWYQSRLLSITPKQSNRDAKSLLQELLQAQGKVLPKYYLQSTSGDDHQQQFLIECEIEHLKQRFSGEGSSRRTAEQQAAAAALAFLS